MRVVRKLTIYIIKIQCVQLRRCPFQGGDSVCGEILYVVAPVVGGPRFVLSSFCLYWLCGPESPHHLKAPDSALLRIFRMQYLVPLRLFKWCSGFYRSLLFTQHAPEGDPDNIFFYFLVLNVFQTSFERVGVGVRTRIYKENYSHL